jgi:hypothetical protein
MRWRLHRKCSHAWCFVTSFDPWIRQSSPRLSPPLTLFSSAASRSLFSSLPAVSHSRMSVLRAPSFGRSMLVLYACFAPLRSCSSDARGDVALCTLVPLRVRACPWWGTLSWDVFANAVDQGPRGRNLMYESHCRTAAANARSLGHSMSDGVLLVDLPHVQPPVSRAVVGPAIGSVRFERGHEETHPGDDSAHLLHDIYGLFAG